MTRSVTERVFTRVVLLLFAVFALMPVVTILVTALRPEVVGQGAWNPQNFVTAWEHGHFATYLRTSALVSSTVVVVATVLSVLAGYAFATMSFRGREVLFFVFLLGVMVPSEAVVVPLYFNLRDVGLTNTLAALILPQVAQSVAFGVFWMRACFSAGQQEIIDSARLDGAGHWTILWRVLIPIIKPGVVTLVVLVFMWTWNEFLLALVMVTDEGLRTAPLGLRFFQGRSTTSLPLLAAGSVLVAIPVMTLFVFLQRHFIRGIIDGAVKA